MVGQKPLSCTSCPIRVLVCINRTPLLCIEGADNRKNLGCILTDWREAECEIATVSDAPSARSRTHYSSQTCVKGAAGWGRGRQQDLLCARLGMEVEVVLVVVEVKLARKVRKSECSYVT